MSIIPTEPAPASVAADEPAQATGLRPAHVAGGGFAVVVGAVAVAVCNHFGWKLSDADGVLVGGAALGAGAGLGHVVGKVGLAGAFKALWRGSKS